MTECERIIAEGILPESFFEEEVRCDYLVTKKRKKLWAVELDLLLKFDQICRKYGLRYYLNSGSLLGAVRHKGFIPWDDDLDVEMPREDYDRLLSVSNEFCHPYFLQTPDTDPFGGYSFAKLRNSNTTFLSKMFAFQDMNQGVFIDIFPFDKWDKDDRKSFDVINFLNYENSTFLRMGNPFLDETNKKRVEEWSRINPKISYEMVNRIATRYRNIETESIIVAVCSIQSFDKKLKYLEDYSSSVMVPFEGIELPIPNGYHRILSGLFGDYMRFPPIEKRGTWHTDLLFDADVPYQEYLTKYRKEMRG